MTMEWPSDAKMTQEQAEAVLKSLFERYLEGDPSSEGDPRNRPDKLVNRIMWNRAHLNNLSVADPDIPEPYHEGQKFQTGRPLQIHSQLKARLLENPYTVTATTVTGKSTAAADRLEKLLYIGMSDTERRTGRNFMGGLADGQIGLCYGVIHWRRAEEFYPHEMKRLHSNDVSSSDTDWEVTPLDDQDLGAFRETKKAYDRRRQEERLNLGFPYHIEVVHPSQVFVLEDVSMAPGKAMVGHVRRMRVIDYSEKLSEQEGLFLSMNERDKKLLVFREADAPPEMRWQQYSSEVTVVNLWTRDECYELACLSDGGSVDSMNWTYVKHFTHEWGRPPFEFAPGFEMLDSDPVLRWLPALEGIYRIKPAYDRLMSLWMVISEMTALPVWYLESNANGTPMLTEDGKMMTFSRSSASAERIPPGYSLKKMEWSIRPELIESIRMFAEELTAAEPSTGLASFSASTQPWTARLEQQQQSIQPKMLLNSIVSCMRNMVDDLVKDMARRDEPTTVFSHDGTGRKGEVIEVTPAECARLRAFVNVDSVSSAERFSKLEMGRTLLNDPKIQMTLHEFVEDYEGKQDASEVILEREVNTYFETYEKPILMNKMAMARMGSDITFHPESMKFFGAAGNEMAPADVMGQKTGMGAGTTPASAEGGMRNPGMPEMGPLQAPGTVQVEGLR